MSLVAIETEAGQKYYSFLNFAWGFIADVDIESERFRYDMSSSPNGISKENGTM